MTLNIQLFNAILSMDAYNRGYDGSIQLPTILNSSQIGNATIVDDKGDLDAQNIGFYAVSYDYQGETIISYRGTDDPINSIWSLLTSQDVWNGWSAGAGNNPLEAAQAAMAIEFYQANAGSGNYLTADISFTGHSLGGGLAALVGNIYGQDSNVYDAMPFLYALGNTKLEVENGNVDLQNLIFGTQPHWTINESHTSISNLTSGSYISGEALELIRDLVVPTQPEYQDENSLYSDQYLASYGQNIAGLNSVDLHSPSTLIIDMYGDTELGGVKDWENAAQYFWPVLYDGAFARDYVLTDLTNLSGTLLNSAQGGQTEKYADILRTILAYSAIDEGERPFGDTGIRALYNDANDLGKVIEDVGGAISIGTDISKAFVHFAGQLALNDIEEADDTSTQASDGVLTYNDTPTNKSLTINVSDSYWDQLITSNTHGLSSTRQELLTNIASAYGWYVDPDPRSIFALAGGIWGDNTTNLYDRVTLAIPEIVNGAYLNTNIVLPEPLSLGKVGLYFGNLGNENVLGSSGNDFISAQLGDDTIIGNAGNDFIHGDKGFDTVDYSQNASLGGFSGISVTSLGQGGIYDVTDGFGDQDDLDEVEKIIFTNSDDTLHINGNHLVGGFDNVFDARGGTDTATITGGVYEHATGFLYDLDGVTRASLLNFETIDHQSIQHVGIPDFNQQTLTLLGNGIYDYSSYTGAIDVTYTTSDILSSSSGYTYDYSQSVNVVADNSSFSHLGSGTGNGLNANINDAISQGLADFHSNWAPITIIGTNNGDTFNFEHNAYFGPNSSTIIESGFGSDVTNFTDNSGTPTTAGNVQYVYTGGSDTINGADGISSIVIRNDFFIDHISPSFTNGNLFLNFGSGNSLRVNDVSSAAPSIIFEAGGSLSIDTTTGTVTKNGSTSNDITVFGSWGNDVWEAYDYLKHYNYTFIGKAGNDTAIAEDGDDNLIGGLGDDSLEGKGGNDTYVYNSGADDIFDLNGTDTLMVWDGVSLDNINFIESDGDTTITFGNNDSIFIRNHTYLNPSIENVIYGEDGTSITYQQFYDFYNPGATPQGLIGNNGNNTITGTSTADIVSALQGNDVVYGNEGNDIIYGGGGIDVLYGGDGDDIIDAGEDDDIVYGGSGNDTFYVSYGTDVISDSDGYDRIIFTNLSSNEVNLFRYKIGGTYPFGNGLDLADNEDLNLSFNGMDTQIVVKNQFTENFKIEEIEFADGIVYKTSEIRAREYYTNSDQTINSIQFGASIHNIVDAGRGNDIINTFDGSDYIQASWGNDEINAGSGDDTIDPGTDNDIVDAGPGNDVIYIGQGTDSITTGNGNDILVPLRENNTRGIYETAVTTVNDFDIAKDKIDLSTFKDKYEVIYNFDDLNISEVNGNTEILLPGLEVSNGPYVYNNPHKIILDGVSLSNINANHFIFRDWLPFEIDEFQNPPQSTLLGTSNNDTLTSSNNDGQIINGLEGDDIIIGGNGNDYLIGGSGYNDIDGGQGNDILTTDFSGILKGGEGDDYYVIDAENYSNIIISDSSGSDTIIVQNLSDGFDRDYLTLERDYDSDEQNESSLYVSYFGEFSILIDDFFYFNERVENIMLDEQLYDLKRLYDWSIGIDSYRYYPTTNDSERVNAKDDIFSVEADEYVYGNILIDNGFGIDYSPLASELYVSTFTLDTDIPWGWNGEILSGDFGFLKIEDSGDFVFKANADFSGQLVFDYTVRGGYQVFTQNVTSGYNIPLGNANVIFNVSAPTNTSPIAQDDNFSGYQDADVTGNVLADNGNGADTDPDGDPLNVIAGTYTTAQNGSIILASNGDFTYTPPNGFYGNDSFDYTLEDGQGGSDVGTVSLTINEVNSDLITFTSGDVLSYSGSQDVTSANFDVLDNGSTLHLWGNTWKALDFDYTVTSNTILEFDYRSTAEGEIQGIGVDNTINSSQPDPLFELFGTDDYFVNRIDDYDLSDGWKHYRIDLGNYYNGNINYLTFFNDHDVANPDSNSFFSNVQLYEGLEGQVFLDESNILSYSGSQDVTPSNFEVLDNGDTLHIWGNTWKALDFDYTVTADTILEFDYRSTAEGEIQGIGVDTTINASQPDPLFELFGTDSYFANRIDDYDLSDGWKHYRIDLGNYYNGNINYLTFFNDHDVANPDANSYFRNIQVYDAPGLISFEASDILSYSGSQDVTPANFEILDNGDTLHIWGNTWKAIDFDYTVAADTVLQFDYRSTSEGEIQGIGVDNNLGAFQPDPLFELFGTDSYFANRIDNYDTADGWTHYTIDLGSYYTGAINYLTFFNDHDVADPDANSYFRNVQLYDTGGINGSSDDDVLYGTSTDDALFGFEGDDTLSGGQGSDTLTGGEGADTFAWLAGDVGNGVDTLTDFKTLHDDVLDVSDVLFGYDALSDALSDFVQITDDGTDSFLDVDADGTANGSNFTRIATIENVTGLDASALEASGNLRTEVV